MMVRFKRKAIPLLIVLISLSIFSFFYVDPYIAKLCMDMSHIYRNYLKIVSLSLSPPFHVIFWCIIYLITKYSSASPRLFLISRQIFFCLLISLSLIYCMKILLGRARPELLADNIYGFYFVMQNHHYHSFPSGHAAVSACLFTTLLSKIPRFKVYWIILSIVLSSSRVMLNYHFVSDILASGVIGYMVQEWYRMYIETIEIKKKGNQIYTIRFPKV